MQNGLPVSPPQEVVSRGTKGTHAADIPAVSHRFSKRPIMDKDYVGFATLPTQVHRKTVKKGFDFTLMVAARIPQTLEIVKHAVDIEEQGVKVKLTSGLDRKNIQDGRVHCCLYVLSPFGHGLRPLDIEFLRAIHDKVSILPVIGKADCLTPKEIRQELEANSICIYEFPELENAAHCDFLKLRNMLIQTHMQDLKDVTHEVHYENYRAQYIQSLTRSGARDRSSRASVGCRKCYGKCRSRCCRTRENNATACEKASFSKNQRNPRRGDWLIFGSEEPTSFGKCPG
ncbi:hypothetical protein E2320_003309 [Naja naja]|nr:hypothetical protein E2320_003309 [Naja naja]